MCGVNGLMAAEFQQEFSAITQEVVVLIPTRWGLNALQSKGDQDSKVYIANDFFFLLSSNISRMKSV